MPTTTQKSFHCAVENLSVQRGGHQIFQQLNSSISSGSRLAIVGENGRGKTTLLHTLIGRIVADEGTIHRSGSVGVAEQELHLGEYFTVGDLIDEALTESRAAVTEFDDAAAALAEVSAAQASTTQAPESEASADRFAAALERAEQLEAWDADRRVDIALEALDACVDRNRVLSTLSVGQRYRVRLACLLGAHQDLLLLDEPTNHLDASGLDFLTRKIREHPGAVALISHDRQLLADSATHFLDLDPTPDGVPRLYGGGYNGWQQGRAAMLEAWEQEYSHQIEERRRLSDSLSVAQNRLSTGWRPDKGTGRHQRQSRAPGVVQQVKRQTAELEAHEITMPRPPLRLKMPSLHARPTVTYLSAESISLVGRLKGPVNFTLRGGDKLLVTGPNGAGKSTLLRLLTQQLPPSSGEVRL